MCRFFLAIILNLIFLSVSFSVFCEVIPFDSKEWVIKGKENRIENYKGKKALYLKGGTAHLKDVEFLDGVIEFDIAIPNEFGFMGVMWRIQDLKNFEDFYLRSSRSGQPDANQYTPIFNGLSGWQLYHGKDFSSPTVYKFDTWMHVKVVVSGNRGAVYLMDMEKPALIIPKFKREYKAGSIGVKVTDFAPARFANFQYRKTAEPIPAGEKRTVKKPDAGTIFNYQISNPFDEKTLKDVTYLNDSQINGLKWKRFQTEATGIGNLARVAQISVGNTVFAKLTVESEKDQIKKMHFGYSDRIIVFANRQPLYSGNNVWRSRDFRYLGTIGYFDEVYLPLKKGKNEILMAVSEGFGGWGLMTKFPNMEGIKIK